MSEKKTKVTKTQNKTQKNAAKPSAKTAAKSSGKKKTSKPKAENKSKSEKPAKTRAPKPKKKLKIIPLGGLLEIGKNKDVTVNLRHMMDFGGRKFTVKVLNNGEIAHSMSELIDLAGEYVWRPQK